MAPIRQTHLSNPNTNALMYMLQGALKPNKATAAGFNFFEIGTDKLPVSVIILSGMVSLTTRDPRTTWY